MKRPPAIYLGDFIGENKPRPFRPTPFAQMLGLCLMFWLLVLAAVYTL